MKKINFAGDPFETNMHLHPPMVFASVYQARQKLELRASTAAGLGGETSGRSSTFLQQKLFIPSAVRAPHIPARPQNCRVRLPCFLRRTAVLSTSLSDSQSHFVHKPSAFSSVQQSHGSWTLRISPFHCTNTF